MDAQPVRFFAVFSEKALLAIAGYKDYNGAEENNTLGSKMSEGKGNRNGYVSSHHGWIYLVAALGGCHRFDALEGASAAGA